MASQSLAMRWHLWPCLLALVTRCGGTSPCNDKRSCIAYLQDWLAQQPDSTTSSRAVWAWTHLGAAGGGSINSHWYGQKDCFVKALELDPDYADAWSHLGVAGGGMVGSRMFNQTDCFVKVLTFNQNSSSAWSHLGTAGGGKVGSTWYSWRECYVKSLELDPSYADSWANLGAAGGGKVRGIWYDQKDCYAKALEIDPASSSTWYNLGAAGGGRVNAITFSDRDCYVRSLELDPKFAPAWTNLGTCGGGKVKGRCDGEMCSPRDCYVAALEVDPKYTDAWSLLGDLGGGQVGSKRYSWRDCKAKAKAGALHQEAQTWYNFGLLGSGMLGARRCSEDECFQKAADSLDQELEAAVSRLPINSATAFRDITTVLLGSSRYEFKARMAAVYRKCHPPSPSCMSAEAQQDQFAAELGRQVPHEPDMIRAVLKGALSEMQYTKSKQVGDELLLKAACKAQRAWQRQHTSRRLAAPQAEPAN